MYRHRDIDESFAPGFIVGLCFSNNYKDMLAVCYKEVFSFVYRLELCWLKQQTVGKK